MNLSVVSGYLADVPKQMYTDKLSGQPVYGIRLGSSKRSYNKQTKQPEKKTIWCSGLVNHKSIEYILPSLKKGTHVTVVSLDEEPEIFNGQATRNLGRISRIEAGNLHTSTTPTPVVAPQQQQPQQPVQQLHPAQQPPQGQLPDAFDGYPF